MTTESDSDICSMCRNTRGWHKTNFARHPFTPVGAIGHLPSQGDEQRQEPLGIVRTTMPMDPVLRMALIDKGILTTDDLGAAEQKIKFLTGGVSDGEQIRKPDIRDGHPQGH